MLRLTRDLRSNDFDSYDHLNQAIYHALLEDARIALIRDLLGPDFEMVMAHTELDHRREIRAGEAAATIEVAVAAVGRSSITLRQAVVRLDGEVAAEGAAVLVAWDPERRGSRSLTEAERSTLAAAMPDSGGAPAGPLSA